MWCMSACSVWPAPMAPAPHRAAQHRSGDQQRRGGVPVDQDGLDLGAAAPPQVHPSPEEIEERLLGKPATMGRREVSREAQVSVLAARKFWHALGFPIVQDEDAMFTEADLSALKAVA